MNGDDSLEPYFCGFSRWIISGQCPSSTLTFKAGHCKLGPLPFRGWCQCGRTTWGPAPMQDRANSSPVPTQGHFQLTARAPRGSAFGLTEIQAFELCDVRNAEPDKNGIVGHAQCNSYFQPRQVPNQGQCQLANRRLLTTAIANQGECQIKARSN